MSGRTKGPRGTHATRGPRVWDPCSKPRSESNCALICSFAFWCQSEETKTRKDLSI